MKKLSILVLSAMLGVSGFAAVPAMAATATAAKLDVVPSCTSGRFDEFQKNPDLVAGMLQSDGVKFSSLSEWNGCIKAMTTDADGHTAMAFYDPTSLRLVGTIG